MRVVVVQTTADEMKIALCPHLSLEHYRGGEKWTTTLANRLAADGFDVAVRALPYTPRDERRVAATDVLDDSVSYRERWHHNLSGFDSAYLFYHPFARSFFTGETRAIAGIHSWVYLTKQLYEPHYGIVPTTAKLLYRALGKHAFDRFDAVHTVTDSYTSPHQNTHYIPNFVDTSLFRPTESTREEPFTVLVTAAQLRSKGWDRTRAIAATLADELRVVTTGDSDHPAIEGLGFLDEGALADAYANAHAVLHPTRIDADSLVIKEALAAGTPVVTTPLRTHPPEGAAVLHGSTVGNLVARLRTLRWEWSHDSGYERRCRSARQVGERHSFETVYPQLKALLTTSEQADG
ncbi:glycosyltransferase family 4 protein [Halococcus salsus]|uniref:glycosyltransferase family 4 protein n=1 Tax=Halococcus salsus TaxID=2162894 RepID=UPI001357498D|nr:glycosyltransferase family 4 protein [Halococcus salsus]